MISKPIRVPKFLAHVARRQRDMERLIHRAMILDSPEIRAEKLPDGRVMLHPRTPGTGARIVPTVAPAPPSVLPLAHIWIANDLSFQAQHTANDAYCFYPAGPDAGNSIPADAGTFIAMDGNLYAPDIYNHPSTSAFSIGFFTPFATFDPDATVDLADVGTKITELDIGSLHIKQTDTWTSGTDYITTTIELTGTGTGILYRAFDTFLFGFDLSYGFLETLSGSRNAPGCSLNANNSPPDKFQELIPTTESNNYAQGNYDGIWSLIGSQAALPDFSDPSSFQDTGAAISWNFTAPATFTHVTKVFAPPV